MSDTSYKQITLEGLWKNNPALVQLLGLCPLMAVSASVVNALGLGFATAVVMALSSGVVSMIRNVTPDTIRLPTFVMVIASFVACVALIMQAFAFQLYQVLGIFIPLIVTNCNVLARADGFAAKNRFLPSMYDGFIMGIGFMTVLVVLGAIRELLGTGQLFANMDLLFGPAARDWKLDVFGAAYPQFLLAILPPGAFIFGGLLIAGKNAIDAGIKARQAAAEAAPAHTDRRVRVTGQIS